MDFIQLKKYLGAILMPLPLCAILLLIAFIAMMNKRSRIATIAGSFSLLIFLISSTPFFPDYALKNIESKYPQFDLSITVNHIVILGCAHTNDASLPITSQLYPCSLTRVTEAVRLLRFNPDATVIVSGAAFTQDFSNAEMNKRMLMALGVPEKSIEMYAESRDTEDEAQNLSAVLSDEPFALVTSASHMSRSVRLFNQYGLNPIAAPTEHLVREAGNKPLTSYFPASKNIHKTERWWYETLGQGWLTIKSWFR